jgi:branched-chain amino acid transport system ATP-binding protein
MAAIGRGLMSKPRLLMLDEPSLGLSPILVADIFRVIKEVHAAGVTVLLVEQNVFRTLEVADRAYVLGNGRIVLQGSGAELLANDHVRKAYLGL